MLLTDEQLEAAAQILGWYNRSHNQHWTLGGYAGTGKTTVVSQSLANLELPKSDIVLCAYAAKAVSVLKAKTPDYQARTIHSLIYRPISTPAMDALRNQLADCRTAPQTPIVASDIIRISVKLKELRKQNPREWRLKTDDEFSKGGDISLIVADECSMIGERMFNDLMSFGTKVLFVGDPGQLDPIQTGKRELKLHDLAPVTTC
jgi:exodeoxyribonuclease-5